MTESLAGMKVAILVTNGFEQAELDEPRKALHAAGARTFIVSSEKGTIQGMNHNEKGDEYEVDLNFDKAKPEDFDAALLPGGVVNADRLRMDRRAQRFVQSIEKSHKPVAVICHGPWLLISSGLTKERRLTSYYTLQDDLRNAGAVWSDQETVLDGNWISSRQPEDIPAFNKAMIELFAKYLRPAESATHT